MTSSDIYNRGDCIVAIINHDFRTTDLAYCHFTTRFLYGKVLEQGTKDNVTVAYKYAYTGDGDNWTGRKTPQWKNEKTQLAQRIPPDCWLNDEKTAIFLKLQGLATEFGLL